MLIFCSVKYSKFITFFLLKIASFASLLNMLNEHVDNFHSKHQYRADSSERKAKLAKEERVLFHMQLPKAIYGYSSF